MEKFIEPRENSKNYDTLYMGYAQATSAVKILQQKVHDLENAGRKKDYIIFLQRQQIEALGGEQPDLSELERYELLDFASGKI